MNYSIYEYDGKNEFVLASSVSGNILEIDDVKAFARIDDTQLSGFDAQNDLILTDLIEASYEKFTQITNLHLLQTSYKQSYSLLSCFETATVVLPHTNVTITSISLYDQNSTEYPIASTDYSVDAKHGEVTIKLYDTTIPYYLQTFDNFIIEYDTGLFDNPEDVTEDIKTALKQTISHSYENRQSMTDIALRATPDSAMATFKRYKPRKR